MFLKTSIVTRDLVGVGGRAGTAFKCHEVKSPGMVHSAWDRIFHSCSNPGLVPSTGSGPGFPMLAAGGEDRPVGLPQKKGACSTGGQLGRDMEG